jgi:hypothetical protein
MLCEKIKLTEKNVRRTVVGGRTRYRATNANVANGETAVRLSKDAQYCDAKTKRTDWKNYGKVFKLREKWKIFEKSRQ